MKTPKLSMQKIKALTSKHGVRMVIAQDAEGFAVFTADEWSQGSDFRYPEFDGIVGIEEALAQARNY